MSEERQVKQAAFVETTPALAFEAVTSASELREWFSDQAWADVRPGGRFALHWNQGYHVEGRFTELDPPRHAAIAWMGTSEPGGTVVDFSIEPQEGGVEVTVVHSGFGPGEEWTEPLVQAEKGWSVGLENLKSTLETGVDLRLARQPFLGIYPDFFDTDRATKEGIAAERGIYIGGTVEGSGAEAAGLGKADVIVALGGVETPGFDELTAALRSHRASDTVDVELVRGQQRETVQIELGGRPQVEVPDNADALADRLAELHQEVDAELRAALEGVSDGEAEEKPSDDEWSVKQVLAHLTDGERAFHFFLVNQALNGWLDAGPVPSDRIPGRQQAILTVTPSLEGLVERFLTDEAESVALVRGLPQTAVEHKARFRRITEGVLYGPDHTREHIGQIRQAVEAVRGAQ